ncbi:MAG: homoserine O-acetyltransferase [Brumimicrobium sp.]|nr:homoserine O-acetyltransferase [Brumimicrobium sp.]
MRNEKLFKEKFFLESGESLPKLKLVYHTYGALSEAKDNVIWVFHALTANSEVLDWWKDLFTEGGALNPDEHFIICANVIGSPYGSTAPVDLDFPDFTVRDVVKSQLLLADELNIRQIKVAIGASFGGSQALEFAFSFSGTIDRLFLIACGAKESPWGIAIHQAQRLALEADQSFGKHGEGRAGLKAARAVGLLTYRCAGAFEKTQSETDDRIKDFKAASYISYQGEKLVRRFDSLSYYYLHKCLDTHNIGRDRGGMLHALGKISAPTVVIGIDTDQLVPVEMQKFLSDNIPKASYAEITSEFGHDGFLIETDQLKMIINKHLN